MNIGFEILAFPCNQFLAQEPGTNEEIVDFVCTKFKSEFPIFSKVKFKQSNIRNQVYFRTLLIKIETLLQYRLRLTLMVSPLRLCTSS